MAPAAPLEVPFEHVYKSFDHAALQDVSLTIARDEMVALVGWAGSGKSVLLSPLRDLATLASLSAGMAKLVAIGRALMMDPVLVMYDSPTAGLDPERAWGIQNLIASTHSRMPSLGIARTTLMVTHDTELLRHLRPRVVMLHDGRVLHDGSFESFAVSSDPLVRPYLQQTSMLNVRDGSDG
jgi:ABC-type transporter Mla maintaining outer membrane lipid asymmetry ATPase subunit MlaF